MKQLRNPNFNVSDDAGWCLRFADKVFNIKAVYPTAWKAWKGTKFPHADRNFPAGVAVPVFFDWWGDVGSGRAQYGHVAVRGADGKIYSSPLKGNGKSVFNSVDALVKAFGGGMIYVGWAEDLSNIRIVEGEDMSKITKEQEIVLAQGVTGYAPGENYNYQFTGRESTQDVLDAMTGFWGGQAPRISKEMESAVADGISGIQGYVGWDNYNSAFVGQPIVSHYPQMVQFWITQKPAPTGDSAKFEKVEVYRRVA